MSGPILKHENGVTSIQRCEYCLKTDIRVNLVSEYSTEAWHYSIGNHIIKVEASVPKGSCPRCGRKWESPHAKKYRDEAFIKAINDFWMEQLNELNIHPGYIKDIVSRVMKKAAEDKQRQVAAEFGRWLAGCEFLY